MIARELTTLATALVFLTRFPAGSVASGDPAELARGTQYFPLVGALIGLIVFSVYLLCSQIWPDSVAIALSLLIAVLITGGFHEDGLADVADSAGAWTVDRRLEIMRDSRIGTYGALSLITVFILKFAALGQIALAGYCHMLAAFVLAHVLGRWSSLPLIYFGTYAREDSNNKVIAEGVTQARFLNGTLIAGVFLAACAALIGFKPLLAALACLLIVAASHHWFKRKIGGITGDCLGASNKLVESAVYLCLATSWS